MPNVFAPEKLPSRGDKGGLPRRVAHDAAGVVYGVVLLGAAVLLVSSMYRGLRRHGLIPPSLHPATSPAQPSWFGE